MTNILMYAQVNAQKQKGQGTNASDNAINFLKVSSNCNIPSMPVDIHMALLP